MPSRTLKESICTSDNFNQLMADEERFCYRLIVNCEDYGRLDCRPAVLRSKCFPVKLDKEGNFTIKLSEIAKWIQGLAKAEMIVVYQNNGRPYLQFLTWADHNQVRAKHPKYPAFDEEGSQIIEPDNVCDHLLADENMKKQVRSDSYIRNTNIRKDRNTRSAEDKNSYGEFVKMTIDEYQKLIDKYGEDLTKKFIEKLDNAKGAKGYKYKSDYRAILTWVVEAITGKKASEYKSVSSNDSQLASLYNQSGVIQK